MKSGNRRNAGPRPAYHPGKKSKYRKPHGSTLDKDHRPSERDDDNSMMRARLKAALETDRDDCDEDDHLWERLDDGTRLCLRCRARVRRVGD